jgi:3-deoxy-D-manno-octulosonic-acid transferase
MENFEPLASQWLTADAAIRVTDATSLQSQVAALLRNPERCHDLSERARELVAVHEGATERTVRRLLAAR